MSPMLPLAVLGLGGLALLASGTAKAAQAPSVPVAPPRPTGAPSTPRPPGRGRADVMSRGACFLSDPVPGAPGGLLWIPQRYSRARNAEFIRCVLLDEGFSERIVDAAVANAIAESNLDNLIDGDEDQSVGLFQIRDRDVRKVSGVWRTTFRDFGGHDRRDPVYATRWIVEAELRTSRAEALLSAEADGALSGELAAIFGRDIERPRDRSVGGPTWKRRGWLGEQVAQGRLPDNGEAHARFPNL